MNNPSNVSKTLNFQIACKQKGFPDKSSENPCGEDRARTDDLLTARFSLTLF